MAYAPKQGITVVLDDSFISLHPSFVPKVTVGIESEAAVIGKQWFTYEMYGSNDCNFPQHISPARTYLESTELAYDLKDAGLFKAGTIGCVCVAADEGWLKSTPSSASFLAETSVSTPRKSFIIIICKNSFWIKVSKKYFI